MKETHLLVPDMSCGHCVATVRGALEVLEGVESIDVSLDTKRVIVLSVQELEGRDLMGAVKAVGFTPELAG